MACGLFLAVRSSLVDHPLAGIPGGPAKGCGTAPVIVHRKPACLDDLADLVIAAVFGPTLDAAGGWVALTRGIPT